MRGYASLSRASPAAPPARNCCGVCSSSCRRHPDGRRSARHSSIMLHAMSTCTRPSGLRSRAALGSSATDSPELDGSLPRRRTGAQWRDLHLLAPAGDRRQRARSHPGSRPRHRTGARPSRVARRAAGSVRKHGLRVSPPSSRRLPRHCARWRAAIRHNRRRSRRPAGAAGRAGCRSGSTWPRVQPLTGVRTGESHPSGAASKPAAARA